MIDVGIWKRYTIYLKDKVKDIDMDYFESFLCRIEKDPITTASIDKLLKEGWKVQKFSSSAFDGFCDHEKKEIRLGESLKLYKRDKVLFHEIIHACYPLFPDGFNTLRRTLVDWYAKQLRANSKLLYHAVVSFGLEPQIYDKASYQAFKDRIDVEFLKR